MDKPKGYVDASYLEVVGDLVRRQKEHTYELMHLRPGDRALDVGCGSGTDTIAMARKVGPTGHVTGVDYDPQMIAIADREADKAGVRAWVTHRQADASALPFESSAFDSCRSERLFIHLAEPGRALSEMVRVTKPGGWLVVFDPDWGTQSIDTPEVDTERKLARVHAERRMNNGYSGRQLYRLFKQQRLADLSIEVLGSSWTDYAFTRRIFKLEESEQDALDAHIITEEELERWRAALARADSDGVFFASLTVVLIAGRKPGNASPVPPTQSGMPSTGGLQSGSD